MKDEYRIYCRCIGDIIKYAECKECPHYKENSTEHCTYEK